VYLAADKLLEMLTSLTASSAQLVAKGDGLHSMTAGQQKGETTPGVTLVYVRFDD